MMSPWDLLPSPFAKFHPSILFQYIIKFRRRPKMFVNDLANDWARNFREPSRVVASALLYRNLFLEFQVFEGNAS